MTVIIANIGTSDLAIKIDNYYYPVRFDRSEPNIDDSDLTDNEKSAWHQREAFIKDFICDELKVPLDSKGNFSFREFTSKLLEAYSHEPKTWHQRIRPGRILGVIRASQEPKFQANTAYIFVTDQLATVKQGYPSDSIYLFDILSKWFELELYKLKLEKVVIPQTISAIDQDGLLDYYYKFFVNEINNNETVLISIKGGTPQMQTALKIQAIASAIPKQIFIDPILSIHKILHGEPSKFQLTSYWQYTRNQKYQTAKLLLINRWDFDGAREVLNDWNKAVQFLIKEKIAKETVLAQNKQTLLTVIKALDLGIDFLNLDYQSAKKVLDENQQLKIYLDVDNLFTKDSDGRIINLYTQCRLYWDINQIAIFLTKKSSFYKQTLYRLFSFFNSDKYVQESFCSGDRFAKRSVLKNLFLTNNTNQINQWKSIEDKLDKLDFWCRQRNNLIHSAEGLSQSRMEQFLKEQQQKNNSSAKAACEPRQIRRVMADICNSDLGIVRKEYQEKFVGDKASYYLYSDIVNWVINQLKLEQKQHEK